MQRVAVVDHGLCNIDSMWRALEECGVKADVTSSPHDLELADKIVLPGVGAFPDAMAQLDASGLSAAIREQVGEGVPLLGVCLGMQLLATRSCEVRDTPGLGLIDAEVVRLQPVGDERVPHVGWNEVHVASTCALLDDVPAAADFYFVHSFHMQCVDDNDIAATTPYCGRFTSVVARGNVFGTQFHPEKSQGHGLQLLRNFVAM